MFSAMSKPTKIKYVKCYLSSHVKKYIKSSQQLNIKSQSLKQMPLLKYQQCQTFPNYESLKDE